MFTLLLLFHRDFILFQYFLVVQWFYTLWNIFHPRQFPSTIIFLFFLADRNICSFSSRLAAFIFVRTPCLDVYPDAMFLDMNQSKIEVIRFCETILRAIYQFVVVVEFL